MRSLGHKFEYEEVKTKFQQIYWGPDDRGNVRGKSGCWRAQDCAAGEAGELAIFTGRVWRELDYTLDRNRVREVFQTIVTTEDVANPKPDPEGLLKILNGRDPDEALYVGDNVDDALAAQAAQVPFVAVLPKTVHERRERSARLRELGALAILPDVNELEQWLAKLHGSKSLAGSPRKPRASTKR